MDRSERYKQAALLTINAIVKIKQGVDSLKRRALCTGLSCAAAVLRRKGDDRAANHCDLLRQFVLTDEVPAGL